MTPATPSKPRATIVMTARERHVLTERSIASILANTPPPFRLIYADGATPAPLWRRLVTRASRGEFEIFDPGPDPWPTHVRREVLDLVDTDYIVFIDNDVLVEPGWLDALVKCADETGAGAVGPLYLIGAEDDRAIHMSYGALDWRLTPSGLVMKEDHVDSGHDEPDEGSLVRQRCDFVEYHCVLVRTEAVRDGTAFDPGIVCVHEHIHLALTLAQRGYPTWTEPASRVTYLSKEPWTLGEVPHRRARWSMAACDASIAAFCRRWGVDDDFRSFGGVRQFVRHHNRRVDLVRPEAIGRADLAVPMEPAELVHSRSELLDLSYVRGCDVDERRELAHYCDVASILMNGGYRGCGRSFAAHLIGTAGVLLRYGFTPELVLSGLMHAVYTHCPELPPGQKSSIETVCDILGGRGAPIEHRVRLYSRFGEDLSSLAASKRAEDLSIDEAEIVVLVAANDADMALSGEYRYTGRRSRVDAAGLALVRDVCRILGTEGLAATLERAREIPDAPPEVRAGSRMSYRIVGLERKPMLSKAFRAFDDQPPGESYVD